MGLANWQIALFCHGIAAHDEDQDCAAHVEHNNALSMRLWFQSTV